MPDKIPSGFQTEAEATSEHGELGGLTIATWVKGMHKLPCTLYTDRNGSNLFVIEVNGEKHYLPVGTD